MSEGARWQAAAQTLRFALVSGNAGVDGAGPLIDAAGEGLDVLEALLAEPHGDIERACAMVAENDGGLGGVEFLEARWDIAHGNVSRAGDGGDLELPSFADVKEQGWGWLAAGGGEAIDRDFGWKCVGHEPRIAGTGRKSLPAVRLLTSVTSNGRTLGSQRTLTGSPAAQPSEFAAGAGLLLRLWADGARVVSQVEAQWRVLLIWHVLEGMGSIWRRYSSSKTRFTPAQD